MRWTDVGGELASQYLKMDSSKCHWIGTKCDVFLRISGCPSYCHADTECFSQLLRLKSKWQVASSIDMRLIHHNSGELFLLIGHFSLAETLPVSAQIPSL